MTTTGSAVVVVVMRGWSHVEPDYMAFVMCVIVSINISTVPRLYLYHCYYKRYSPILRKWD